MLERIDVSGSISAAANAMGMSFKAAWQAVETMNDMSDQPVVSRPCPRRALPTPSAS